MDIIEILRSAFHKDFQLVEKRHNLYQLFVPIYYEDGDMMDIFLQQTTNNYIRVCDCGLTLMRLSYTFELNSEKKKHILRTILSENDAAVENGNIFIDTTRELLFETIMQFSQVLTKVSAMKMLSRKSTKNMFYEDLETYIADTFKDFNPQKNYLPIAGKDEYCVDYRLTAGNNDLFLFAIRGDAKALSSIVSILTFQQKKIPFNSVIVHDDYNTLSLATQKRIMNVADKQFFDWASFKDSASDYFSRLAG